MKQTTQIMTFLATGFLAVSLQAADEKTPAPAAQPAAPAAEQAAPADKK